jgi:homoserine kinase
VSTVPTAALASAKAVAIRLRLPATSANLGPGFDTLALALALYLEVDARAADVFSIHAEGRAPEICGMLTGNLMLDTYAALWQRYGQGNPQPLAMTVRNGIPLGMGCGSSAASRLAGIALASHFAALGWDQARMLDEAALLEHHPDNAAACCLGGFVTAAYGAPVDQDAPCRVEALSITPPADWCALLALPEIPLATTASRAILPEHYDRSLVVHNLQNVALLVAAFAQGDGRLLARATADRMHQPFRGEVCPLLPRLLPLAGFCGILSVTLSGAGSGVLLLLEHSRALPAAMQAVTEAASAGSKPVVLSELLPCGLATGSALLRAYDHQSVIKPRKDTPAVT